MFCPPLFSINYSAILSFCLIGVIINDYKNHVVSRLIESTYHMILYIEPGFDVHQAHLFPIHYSCPIRSHHPPCGYTTLAAARFKSGW